MNHLSMNNYFRYLIMQSKFKFTFQMKQLYSEKEMLMASNKSLAEYNLSQEPMLQQKRQVGFINEINNHLLSF